MKVYVVSYLIYPPRDITGLLKDLMKPPAKWAQYLDETWFIATNESSKELLDRLKPHLYVDQGHHDSLFIGLLDQNADVEGLMPTEFWAWLHERMKP